MKPLAWLFNIAGTTCALFLLLSCGIFEPIQDVSGLDIASTYPSAGATNIPLDAKVTVTFLEPIDSSTLNITAYNMLKDEEVLGEIFYNKATMTAAFEPLYPWQYGASYQIALAEGLKDDGQRVILKNDFAWDFETVSGPIITSVFPPEGSSGVAHDIAIEVEFSEEMNPLTINRFSFFLEENIPVFGDISYDAPRKTAIFVPGVPLLSATTYTVTVTGAIQDNRGNPLAAEYSWEFNSADTTAPTVSHTQPAAEEENVDPNSALRAVFTKDIDAASVSESSLSLLEDALLPGQVSYEAATQTLSFIPLNPLGLMRRFTATLSADIIDLFGNQLGTNYSWNFTTRDGAWRIPTRVSSGTTIWEPEPRVALDALGNGLAVWHRLFSNGSAAAFGSAYKNITGWETHLQLGPGADLNTSPEVSMNAAGEGIAVWVSAQGGLWKIYASKYTHATGWQTSTMISLNNSVMALHPDVAIDDQGNVLAVWQQAGIRGRRYIKGSGWGNISRLDAGTAEPFTPNVVINSQGTAGFVSWIQMHGNYHSVFSNRWSAAQGFTGAQVVEDIHSDDIWSSRLAMDGAGNALVSWHTSADFYANYYRNGTGWQGEQKLDNSGSCGDGDVALNEAGDGLAVWVQEINGSRATFARRFLASSGWQGRKQLSVDHPGAAVWPRAGMDAVGNALAIWHHYTGDDPSIYAARFTPKTGWQPATLLEGNQVGDANWADIAVNPDGHALAIWQMDDPQRNRIYAVKFE